MNKGAEAWKAGAPPCAEVGLLCVMNGTGLQPLPSQGVMSLRLVASAARRPGPPVTVRTFAEAVPSAWKALLLLSAVLRPHLLSLGGLS